MPKKHFPQSEVDIKWEKMIRYWDLSNKRWEITKALWREYPERMMESTKNLAEYCLSSGLVKCRHEI